MEILLFLCLCSLYTRSKMSRARLCPFVLGALNCNQVENYSILAIQRSREWHFAASGNPPLWFIGRGRFESVSWGKEGLWCTSNCVLMQIALHTVSYLPCYLTYIFLAVSSDNGIAAVKVSIFKQCTSTFSWEIRNTNWLETICQKLISRI